MNNDEWIAFLDGLTPEQRVAVDRARDHFGVVYDGTLGALLKMLKQTEEHQAGVRGQLARFIGNQEMVAEHLSRQGEKIDRVVEKVENVSVGLTTLASEFSATGERLSEWQGDMDTWRQAVDAELASFRQSRDQSIAERKAHQQQLEESRRDRQQIHDELENAAGERARMAETLARIERLVGGLPSDGER